ncbi:hypothetical protein SUGI_1488010 [Cryptomeria japonica]|uniref:Uncharacterized protein n=1 Tax=Cryptomeria japonica TaxID=3369 RepID=A0AAD3NSQ7_CRYJA|nr:hypothetical protein SUGI_1488010 [Cryptomeria japonica]
MHGSDHQLIGMVRMPAKAINHKPSESLASFTETGETRSNASAFAQTGSNGAAFTVAGSESTGSTAASIGSTGTPTGAFTRSTSFLTGSIGTSEDAGRDTLFVYGRTGSATFATGSRPRYGTTGYATGTGFGSADAKSTQYAFVSPATTNLLPPTLWDNRGYDLSISIYNYIVALRGSALYGSGIGSYAGGPCPTPSPLPCYLLLSRCHPRFSCGLYPCLRWIFDRGGWEDLARYRSVSTAGARSPITFMTTDYGFRTVTISRSLNGIIRRRDGRDWIDGYTTYAFPFTLHGFWVN